VELLAAKAPSLGSALEDFAGAGDSTVAITGLEDEKIFR